MKLLLDPLDLKPEFLDDDKNQKCSTRNVTFEKLNEQSQNAVIAVSQAIFYAWDRKTHNAIYPPK